MSYIPLLNKFRGALIGSIIGQKLAKQSKHKIGLPSRIVFDDETDKQWFCWSDRDMIGVREQEQEQNIKRKREHKANKSVKESNSTMLLSTLPKILYFYDCWSILSNLLTEQGESLQKPQEEIDNILVWCYIVRLVLRGELTNGSLTERVVMGTKLQKTSAIFWLEKVEMSCLKGLSSRQLLEELSLMTNLEIPLSVFCFLNNPEDFSLAVKQALTLESRAVDTTTLSSILSGAYNGLRGIPLYWLNSCQDRGFYQQIAIETEKTLDRWLGRDDLASKNTMRSVIDSPKVLQRRSSLKIISQQEYEST